MAGFSVEYVRFKTGRERIKGLRLIHYGLPHPDIFCKHPGPRNEDPVFQWAEKKHPAQCLKRMLLEKALSANYHKEAIHSGSQGKNEDSD